MLKYMYSNTKNNLPNNQNGIPRLFKAEPRGKQKRTGDISNTAQGGEEREEKKKKRWGGWGCKMKDFVSLCVKTQTKIVSIPPILAERNSSSGGGGFYIYIYNIATILLYYTYTYTLQTPPNVHTIHVNTYLQLSYPIIQSYINTYICIQKIKRPDYIIHISKKRKKKIW